MITHKKPLNKPLAGDALLACPKCGYTRWDKLNREVYHRCNKHRSNLTQLKEA